MNDADGGHAQERGGDQRDQRQRALQEDVGEREREILIEDRERQRQRGVMARAARPATTHRPGAAGSSAAPTPQRSDSAAAHSARLRTRLASRDGSQRDHQRDERIREQPHPERRRQRRASPCRVCVQRGGDSAHRVRHRGHDLPAASPDPRPVALVAQDRMHDDRGQKPRAEKPAAIRNVKGPAMPIFGSSYAGSAHRFQIRPENRGAQGATGRRVVSRLRASRAAPSPAASRRARCPCSGRPDSTVRSLPLSYASTLRAIAVQPEPEPHGQAVLTGEWSLAADQPFSL